MPKPSKPLREYDGRRDADVHEWFGLSYSHYLVLPRSLMSAMPVEWQGRMVVCLREMQDACRNLKVNDKYTVLLRASKGRIEKDPYSDYRHSTVENLEILKRQDKRRKST